MKAIVIDEFGGAEKLHLKEVQKPEPLHGEVLIKVDAAGVNPVDWKIREGMLKKRLPHEFPIILGWDVAGVISAVGEGVNHLKVGDQVYSYVRKPIVKWGAYAEYVAFQARDVVKKPTNISMVQAASLPLVALTAWQSLFDSAHLKEGQTVLILGGSGGVGSLAIQFAKAVGAHVLATASANKHAYIKRLGADQAIDYNLPITGAIKEQVDLIFDCVGGEIVQKSLPCLKRGGRFVTIVTSLPEEEAKKRDILASYVFVSPRGDQLAEIAKLIEEGKVFPPEVVEMPIQEAARAQEELRQGKVFGKAVLTFTAKHNSPPGAP